MQRVTTNFGPPIVNTPDEDVGMYIGYLAGSSGSMLTWQEWQNIIMPKYKAWRARNRRVTLVDRFVYLRSVCNVYILERNK